MTWVAWSLLSAVFAAVTAILAKLGVAGINSNLATAIRTSVVFLLAWGIALASVPGSAFSHIGRRTLLFLALSGLATGLSWLCYFRALQLGQASRVGAARQTERRLRAGIRRRISRRAHDACHRRRRAADCRRRRDSGGAVKAVSSGRQRASCDIVRVPELKRWWSPAAYPHSFSVYQIGIVERIHYL